MPRLWMQLQQQRFRAWARWPCQRRAGGWLAGCALALLMLAGPPGWAQSVELRALKLERRDGELVLEFATRLSLGPAIEDALQRGVPIYFVAEAQLYRNRWYWRDERVARVSRSWRVAFQPLTSAWRVSLGGLNQSFPSLAEALAAVSRSAGWRLVELSQLDFDKSFYLEFSYRLDTSQLPGPMQFGLGGPGGPGDWAVGVSRTLRVEL